MKNFLPLFFFLLAFYFLFLLQTSFFTEFNASGTFFYFTAFLLLLLILFENPAKNDGIIVAGFTGFLYDAYSSNPFGFYLIIFSLSAFFLKILLRKYVRPISRRIE